MVKIIMTCFCCITMVTFPGCNSTFPGYHGNTIYSCLYYVTIFPGCNVTCVSSYLSIRLPTSVCLPVCLSSSFSIGPSVHLRVYLSVVRPPSRSECSSCWGWRLWSSPTPPAHWLMATSPVTSWSSKTMSTSRDWPGSTPWPGPTTTSTAYSL